MKDALSPATDLYGLGALALTLLPREDPSTMMMIYGDTGDIADIAGGCDRGYARAANQRACDRLNGEGCESLSWMFETGRGVEKSAETAEHYSELACVGGFAKACERLGMAKP